MLFHVKNTTFPNPLDLIAPHSCRGCDKIGEPLCASCKNYIISHHQDYCPICKKPKTTPKCHNCPKAPKTFVLDTRDTLIGNLIHDLKYQSVRALARPIAEVLDATFPKTKGKVVIVPLPTIAKHIRERGLDHTYLIAKHFARLRGTNYSVAKILLRDKNTVQVGSARKDRLTQASQAYCINPDIKIDPKTTYILLDDVWTTGASLESAYQKMFLAGAKNIFLAILALSVND